MARSIAYPFRLNARGGMAQAENLPAIIALGLLPGESTNPYNKRDGLVPEDLVWEAASPEGYARGEALVRRLMRSLERQRRARLLEVSRAGRSESGELRFRVRFVNLETGATDEVVVAGEI